MRALAWLALVAALFALVLYAVDAAMYRAELAQAHRCMKLADSEAAKLDCLDRYSIRSADR